MFKGSIVALVTPFTGKGADSCKLDEKTLKSLVQFHIKNGTDGIVPCGTTGESATLTTAEHERVVEICIQASQGKIPIIAGTGSNSTEEAVELTKHARRVGADASLLISPYYNRPTQRGLYLHFKAVADSVDIPIVLYNIASRTAVNIEPETIAKLASECKNIVGVKEASGSLDQMSKIISLCPKDFVLMSGDDSLTLPILSIGGTGVISVVANIAPRDVSNLVKEFGAGNIAKARSMHYKLLPLIKAVFLETNPIPVKTAMAMMKLCEPHLRLPMCAIGDENLKKLKAALKNYGLI